MAGSATFRCAIRAVALAVFVQGCASVGTPVTQVVRVETPGCEEVSCTLSNDRGSWHLASAPGAVTVTSSQSPLKVICRTAAGVQVISTMPSTVGDASAAGAVAGGVAGGTAVGAVFGAAALSFIPVLGVIIVASGVATGAAAGQLVEASAQAIRYPDVITLPMNCSTPTAQALRPGATIGLGIRGLPLADAQALGLGKRSAVLVTWVTEGGAAASAGLRSGDIVLAADGRDLRDAAEREERVLTLAPGTPLSLRVWRDGQYLDMTLVRQPVAP